MSDNSFFTNENLQKLIDQTEPESRPGLDVILSAFLNVQYVPPESMGGIGVDVGEYFRGKVSPTVSITPDLIPLAGKIAASLKEALSGECLNVQVDVTGFLFLMDEGKG